MVNAIIAHNEGASFKRVARNSDCNGIEADLVRAIKLLVSKVQECRTTSGSNAAPVTTSALAPGYFDSAVDAFHSRDVEISNSIPPNDKVILYRSLGVHRYSHRFTVSKRCSLITDTRNSVNIVNGSKLLLEKVFRGEEAYIHNL